MKLLSKIILILVCAAMLSANAYAATPAEERAANKFVGYLNKNKNVKALEMIAADGKNKVTPQQFIKVFYNLEFQNFFYGVLNFKFIKALNETTAFSVYSISPAPNESFVLTIEIQRPRAEQYYRQYKQSFDQSLNKGLSNPDYSKALDKYLSENIVDINFAYETVYVRMYLYQEGKNWILSFPANYL